MTDPSPALLELARRIVQEEGDGSPDPAALAAAVGSACRRLKDKLTGVLGSGGFTALLGRALHLAQREQPLLAEVAVDREGIGCFSSLAESLARNSAEVASAAATTLLAHVLQLLVTLMGEDLAMKPIRKLWPASTSAQEIDE